MNPTDAPPPHLVSYFDRPNGDGLGRWLAEREAWERAGGTLPPLRALERCAAQSLHEGGRSS